VLVVLALAALAVLVAVVVLATGRGGELARTHPDHPPLHMPSGRRLTGADVATLHLPHGLWGYQVDVTDEALRRLACALNERDARLAALEAELAELKRRHGHVEEPASWGDAGPAWTGPRMPPWGEPPARRRDGTAEDGGPAHGHPNDPPQTLRKEEQ